VSVGLEREFWWFKLRYHPDLYLLEDFLKKDVDLAFICHFSVTAKMEALQQLQFSPAVSDGSCYRMHGTYGGGIFLL